MLKKFFLLLFFLVLSLPVFTLESEAKFSDLGHGNFTALTPDSESCFSMEFLSNNSEEGLIPVASLHFGFLGAQDNSDKINISLNGKELGEFSSKDLLSLSSKDVSFEGWIRVYFSRLDMKPLNEVNSLEICLTPSSSTPKTTLYSDSKIGYYETADLSRKDSYQMLLLDEAVAGKDLQIKITLKNYGSAEQEISLSYRKEELELRTPWVRFVSGNSFFDGSVPSCADWNGLECIAPGEKTVSYFIRISRADPLMILPAVLSYTNYFGDKIEKMESNRIYLDVKAPNVELIPSISMARKEFAPNEKFPVKVIIQNAGVIDAPKTDLKISSGSLSLGSSSAQFTLPAHETAEFEFMVSAPSEGTHKLDCSLSIPDYRLNFKCNEAEIKVINPALPIEVIGGALLLFVGIAVFAYFFWVKKSKE